MTTTTFRAIPVDQRLYYSICEADHIVRVYAAPDDPWPIYLASFEKLRELAADDWTTWLSSDELRTTYRIAHDELIDRGLISSMAKAKSVED